MSDQRHFDDFETWAVLNPENPSAGDTAGKQWYIATPENIAKLKRDCRDGYLSSVEMLCGKKLILSGVLGPYDEDKHIELVHQQFVWRKGTLHRIYMAPEVKGFDRVYYYSPSVGPRKKITGFQEVFPERVDALMDLGATQAEAEAFRLFYMESAKEVVWRLFHGKIAPRALIRGDWHKPASLVSSCGPYLVGLVANDMGETEKPPTPAEYRKMLARMAREEAREHDHVPRSEVQEPEDPHDFLMSLSADEEI